MYQWKTKNIKSILRGVAGTLAATKLATWFPTIHNIFLSTRCQDRECLAERLLLSATNSIPWLWNNNLFGSREHVTYSIWVFGYDVHLVLSDRNTLTVHSKTLSGLPISIWSPERTPASFDNYQLSEPQICCMHFVDRSMKEKNVILELWKKYVFRANLKV